MQALVVVALIYNWHRRRRRRRPVGI